ncbi:MAG TPA: diguanylate cyclase [Anaerolineales bacterium]|jgi:diguanylate cyclase (GGDEF)-like protein
MQRQTDAQGDVATPQGRPDFERLARRSTDGYFRYRFPEGLTFASPGLAALLGRPQDELQGTGVVWPDLIAANSIAEFDALVEQLRTRQTDQLLTVVQFQRVDEDPVWVELYCLPVFGEFGGVQALDGVARDVSQHLDVADLLSRRSIEQAVLLEAQRELLTSLDFQQTIGLIVEQALRLLEARGSTLFLLEPRTRTLRPTAGAGPDSAIDQGVELTLGEGVSGWVVANGRPILLDSLANDKRGARLLSRLGADASTLSAPLVLGETIAGALTVTGKPGQFGDDDLSFLVALAQVASLALANSRSYQTVERLATVDSLTGAYNRRFLEDNLPDELERAYRMHYPLALMMIDVDNLKAVNDQHGHTQGDEVLRRTVASALQNIRETDWLVRFGGDEFIVVLPGCSPEHLAILADKIQNQLANAEDLAAPVSLSLGGAILDSGWMAPAELLQAADDAERQAKRDGGNRMILRRLTGASQRGSTGQLTRS